MTSSFTCVQSYSFQFPHRSIYSYLPHKKFVSRYSVNELSSEKFGKIFCLSVSLHVSFTVSISLKLHSCCSLHTDADSVLYKVVQIWPGLFVCKQVTVCPGHIWTTLYNHFLSQLRSPTCHAHITILPFVTLFCWFFCETTLTQIRSGAFTLRESPYVGRRSSAWLGFGSLQGRWESSPQPLE